MSSSMFPGRSQRTDDPYAGVVTGENVTVREQDRERKARALESAQRLATARYWLGDETPFAAVEAVGGSGRRFRVEGYDGEFRLSEEFISDPQADPREQGVELYFTDAAGVVHYLRRPRGNPGGPGLHAATISRRLA